VSYPTPGPYPPSGGFEAQPDGPEDYQGGPDLPPRRQGGLLVVLAMIVVVGVVATLAVLRGGVSPVDGQALPAPGGPVAPPGTGTPPSGGGTAPPVSGTPVAPYAPQQGWTTLSSPTSGLSYQMPPTHWKTDPDQGTAGAVTLTEGANRDPYTCGTPVERLLRGVLGSGSTPAIDPTGVGEAVAASAATQYYANGNTPPTVKVDPPQPVQRKTKSGQTLDGVLVRAVASQSTDKCLASQGEVLVFVLAFADHDGVLVVNGDTAGGPATPAPSTDGELRQIIGTAQPTT
jgi:hypothetical protein